MYSAQIDKTEYVIALDQKTGKKLWSVPIGPVFDFAGNAWINGPNSSPSIDGSFLYALGSQGIFVCVDIAKKDLKWKKDLIKELGGVVNPVTGGPGGWGYSSSPLVDGDQVLVAPGGPNGTLATLNKLSGAVVWRSKEIKDDATYTSPIKATIDGTPQYIYVAQEHVYGVAVKDGALLWNYKKERTADEIVAPSPIYHEGKVFVCAAKAGNELFTIAKVGAVFKATTVYANKDLSTMHGGAVFINNHVYAESDLRAWRCIDLATGKVIWTSRKPPAGSVLGVDGMLICFSESEPLVTLVEASPKGFRQLGQFKLPKESTKRKPSGRFWAHPVVANGNLYVRDQELLFCYNVK